MGKMKRVKGTHFILYFFSYVLWMFSYSSLLLCRSLCNKTKSPVKHNFISSIIVVVAVAVVVVIIVSI